MIYFISSGFCFSANAQKRISIWDDRGNELFTKDNFDSTLINKLTLNNLVNKPALSSIGEYRIYIYYGDEVFNWETINKCNSINTWKCPNDYKFMRFSDFPNNEEDTLCYPTGVDSLPNGFWCRVDIEKDSLKIRSYFSIYKHKKIGLKYDILTNDSAIYSNGFLVYKSWHKDSGTYNIKKYDKCGKLETVIYYEKGRLKYYRSPELGIGFFLNTETQNILSIYTTYKNVLHGYEYTFNENGSVGTVRKYEFGKLVGVYNGNVSDYHLQEKK